MPTAGIIVIEVRFDQVHDHVTDMLAMFGIDHDPDCRICSLMFGEPGERRSEEYARLSPSHVVAIDDDEIPYDLRPDACWRCDAATATTEVGLCEPCKTTLTEPELTWRGQEPLLVIFDELADFHPEEDHPLA